MSSLSYGVGSVPYPSIQHGVRHKEGELEKELGPCSGQWGTRMPSWLCDVLLVLVPHRLPLRDFSSLLTFQMGN